jgi:hypothetical protein
MPGGLVAMRTASAAILFEAGVDSGEGGAGARGGGANFLIGRDGAGFGTRPDFGAMQFPRNVGDRFDYQPKREYQT